MALARTTILAVIFAGLAAAGENAQANTYRHVDRLANDVRGLTRELLGEFKVHFRHTASYGHLRSDAVQLYRIADHIHEVAHHHGSVHHLESDLHKADRMFHHLEDVIERITHHTYHPGGGHIDGHTGHVYALMHKLESKLHHLKDDIEKLAHTSHGGHGGHGGKIGNPAYGINFGGGGVYFNGHRWRVRFGR